MKMRHRQNMQIQDKAASAPSAASARTRAQARIVRIVPLKNTVENLFCSWLRYGQRFLLQTNQK